jgi:hypothetical protein
MRLSDAEAPKVGEQFFGWHGQAKVVIQDRDRHVPLSLRQHLCIVYMYLYMHTAY